MGVISKGLLVAGVSVAAMAVALPARADTTKVTVEHQQSYLLNASFSSLDPSDPTGCTSLDAFVTANAGVDHMTPSKAVVGDAAVDVDSYNSCTGQTLFQAIAQTDALPSGEFTASNQYDYASLHATLAATELDTGATFDLRVDMTLTGTSAIYRDTENTNDIYARNCHVLNRWKGTGRDAVATGSVVVQGVNYTPAASTNGEIGWVHDGFEVIGCA